LEAHCLWYCPRDAQFTQHGCKYEMTILERSLATLVACHDGFKTSAH